MTDKVMKLVPADLLMSQVGATRWVPEVGVTKGPCFRRKWALGPLEVMKGPALARRGPVRARRGVLSPKRGGSELHGAHGAQWVQFK